MTNTPNSWRSDMRGALRIARQDGLQRFSIGVTAYRPSGRGIDELKNIPNDQIVALHWPLSKKPVFEYARRRHNQ